MWEVDQEKRASFSKLENSAPVPFFFTLITKQCHFAKRRWTPKLVIRQLWPEIQIIFLKGLEQRRAKQKEFEYHV